MKYYILIWFSIIEFSCSNFKHNVINKKNITFLINVEKKSIDTKNPILKLNLEFKNISNKDVFILGYNDINSFDTLSTYNLSIKYKNKIKMTRLSLYKRKIPKKYDYIKLIPNQIYKLNFEINFSEMFDSFDKYNLRNSDFGVYHIFIKFNDIYLLHNNCIQNIESNEIAINYNQ